MKIRMYAKFNNVTIKKQQHVILRTNIRNQKHIPPPTHHMFEQLLQQHSILRTNIRNQKNIAPPHPTHHMFGRLLQHVKLRVDV